MSRFNRPSTASAGLSPRTSGLSRVCNRVSSWMTAERVAPTAVDAKVLVLLGEKVLVRFGSNDVMRFTSNVLVRFGSNGLVRWGKNTPVRPASKTSSLDQPAGHTA